jgi:hypothetical protein
LTASIIGKKHVITSSKAPTSMSNTAREYPPSFLSTPLPAHPPCKITMKPSLNYTQEKEPTPSLMQEMQITFSPLGKIQPSIYLTPNMYLSPNAYGDTGKCTHTIGNNPESGATSSLTVPSNNGGFGRKNIPHKLNGTQKQPSHKYLTIPTTQPLKPSKTPWPTLLKTAWEIRTAHPYPPLCLGPMIVL